MSNGQANSLSVHLPTRGTRADPLCVGYVQDGKVFSLISSLPSSLSADDAPVFVRMIHRYYAAVWLLGDVHAGRTAWAFSRRPAATLAAGIPEVSRFSCMKFLGVPGVFDYAGLNKDSRYRPRSCCLPRILTASASGL